MIRSGLRKVASKVKRRIKNRLHPEPPVRGGTVSAPVQSSAPDSPALAPTPVSRSGVAPTSPLAGPVAQVPHHEDPTGGAVSHGADGLEDLTRQVVWELFEDMVRPALQADGGDIDLIKVEDNDIYVRLVGACRSCPSSTITMRQGIERLLREEFPQFGHLIQVETGPGHDAAMAAATP